MKRLHWLLVDGATGFGGHEVMLMRFVEELAHQRRVVPHVLAREGTRLRTRSAKFATPMSLTRTSANGRKSILNALRDAYVFMRAAMSVGHHCASSQKGVCWHNLCSPRWRVQWVSA